MGERHQAEKALGSLGMMASAPILWGRNTHVTWPQILSVVLFSTLNYHRFTQSTAGGGAL